MKTKDAVTLFLLVTSLTYATVADEETGEVPNVMTLDGEISGIKEESTKGNVFYSYYAIPYAQSALGELRFKPPKKVSPWTNVKDGSKYPLPCLQVDFLAQATGKIELIGDEDCLYLNIFTSKPGDVSGHLPVMVFIHGGGFMMGSSDEYPPHVLMNHAIVFVTIQYRLGILGFLSTEDEEAPGNLGLRDQTLALSWIQQNIHLFGGDPNEITIFGESAGAVSAHYHLLIPKSAGLFRRAILMSGTALSPWATGGAFSEVAQYIGRNLNCSVEEGSRELISCLQKLPSKDLIPMQMQFSQWFFLTPLLFGPRVDGDYIPLEPERLLIEGQHQKLDIMTGITSHDGAFIVIPMYADERLRSSLQLSFPYVGPISMEFSERDISPLNQTIRIFDYYAGGVNLEANDADNLTRLFTDRFFSIPHDWTCIYYAENVKHHGKNVYRYELSYRGQQSLNDIYNIELGKDYVSHADDLYYLFSGGRIWVPLQIEDDLKMRDIMTTLWTNFAIHGNPTPDDSLGFEWEPASPERLHHLDLKLEPTMEDDQRAEVRDFWASLPLEQNFLLHKEKVANVVITPREDESSNEEDSKDNGPKENSSKDNKEENSGKYDEKETQIEDPINSKDGKDEL